MNAPEVIRYTDCETFVQELTRNVIGRVIRSSSRANFTTVAKAAILQEYRTMYGSFAVRLIPRSREINDAIFVNTNKGELPVFGWRNCTDFMFYFGLQIQKLSICYKNFGPEDYRSIRNLVQTTCGNNGYLYQLTMEDLVDDFPFDTDFGPFTNIENVYFRFPFASNTPIPLDVVASCFPELRLLILEGPIKEPIRPVSIDSMRTLVACNELDDSQNWNQFRRLLELNPQLEHLIITVESISINLLDEPYGDFLDFIQPRLRQLTELYLLGFAITARNIETLIAFFETSQSLKKLQAEIDDEDDELDIPELRAELDRIVNQNQFRSVVRIGRLDISCLPDDVCTRMRETHPKYWHAVTLTKRFQVPRRMLTI